MEHDQVEGGVLFKQLSGRVVFPRNNQFLDRIFVNDFPRILSMWYLKQDGVDELVINKLFVCLFVGMGQ